MSLNTALAGADMAVVLSWLHRRELLQPVSLLEHNRSAIAANLLEGLAVTDPRELSGIFSTADGVLAAYRTNATINAARHPNFDPQTFASSCDTVYICAPATAQAQHAALVVALLDHIRTATYQHRPHPAVCWALDEMAHIAPLADLPATVAEGGSQGLIIQACLQDLSQARTRWGDAADGFSTLFIHKIILPGVADLATLRQIFALAGDTDIQRTSINRPVLPLLGGGRSTKTTHLERHPRLPIDLIAQGQPNQALHLIRTQPHTLHLHPAR